MAPHIPKSLDLPTYLESLSLFEREELAHPQSQLNRRDTDINSPGSLAVRYTASPSDLESFTDSMNIQRRSVVTTQPNYNGAVDPNNVNMKVVQAVIAIICVGMVVGAIWFFFWAKNGGFHFQRGDWDEYKSTVLRRKGPNGTTLSNATKSTRLGGGSVVGEGYSDRDGATSYGDDTSTIYTGTMTELSSSTAPIVKEKQGKYTENKRSRKKRAERNETAREKKEREMKQAEFEGGHDDDVRAYMKEKPARVGGINAAGDTLHYGTDYTNTEPSIGHSAAPYHTQATAQRQSSTQWQQAPASHRASEQKRRSTRETIGNNNNTNKTRRDFSYTIGGQQEQQQFSASVAPSQRSNSPPPMRVPAHTQQSQQPAAAAPPPRYHNTPANPPGSHARSQTSSAYTQPLSELQQSNTKAYHHPIQGLSGARQGGFRRGGGDLDD